MTIPGTPRQYDTRRTAPPAGHRAALADDTAAYLSALAGASRYAALEAQVAAAAHGLRLSVGPALPPTTPGGRCALDYPPEIIFGTLTATDAGRVATTRAIATFAAQWYATGALIALKAMLLGDPITPAELERATDERNERRPGLAAELNMPVYGAHNRPGLPPAAALNTGHDDLDACMGLAWLELGNIYIAAGRLEAHDNGTDRLTHDEMAAATGQADRLHTALATYADLVSDAARYGHGTPPADA